MSLGRLNRVVPGATLALLVVLVQAVWAQGPVTLRGKVTDRTTKEGLPGANIVVKGTSVGASTDLTGAYVIRNVPAGQQTLVVSYVGYKSVTTGVLVPESGSVTQDFALVATTVQGEEIVVTAQAQGQLEAINQQLSSDKIVNVVSEAKIQELPDFNAAQAIARLPGVSTIQSSGEASKVAIRGIAPQYNEVAVSGITLAATGSTQIGAASQGGTSGAINTDRSVDLTMITPYMIKTVEVYKSLTPDMDANAIGGYVNMELREAPEGFKTDVLAQGGYTAKSGKYGNYRFMGAASDRFFDDDFGIYVLANAESYDRNADNMSAVYTPQSATVQPDGFRPVIVTNVTLDRHLETRERLGGNLIMDYRLPAGILKSINVFSRLNSDAQDYSTIMDYQFHNLDFRYTSGDTKTDMAVNTLEYSNDFGFMTAEVKAANTYSRSYVPASPQFDFTQTGGIPGTTQVNAIPQDLVPAVSYLGANKIYLTNISLFSAAYKEDDEVLKGDFKIPFDVQSVTSGVIKVGGVWRYNLHTNDQGTPYAGIHPGSPITNAMVNLLTANYGWRLDSAAQAFPGTNFTSSDGSITNSFLNNSFGSMLWANNPDALKGAATLLSQTPSINAVNSSGSNAGGWFDSPYQRLPNKYRFVERFDAAYAMSTLNFGEDISVVGGVRWEQDKGYFDAFNLADGRDATHQAIDTVFAHPINRYVLPMVQGKWNFLPWADIRYSYTQTLARPDYSELSPHFNMDYTQFNVWAGNPRLVPAHAYNHDVFLTLHSNELGLLSIGGFYKEVDDFTYYTQYKLHPTATAGLDSIASYGIHTGNGNLVYPKDGAILNTYVNATAPAFLRGVEVDFQTRLWYLPGFLDGIVLGVNYSHISSSATYPWRNDTSIVVPPRSVKVVTLNRTRSGRLIDQPDDIMNAYFGYDYEGFSGRLSFLFQGNSVSYIGPFAEQDGFSKNYFRIDASIRQKLPWPGLSLFLDANNLNSEINQSAQASINGFTSQQNYGLTASIGVRYTM
ncbi:MAG TPA: carboxypeptidase-like regulatory domain-containing protein [Bacteroidota bacterium]|nr:carboxypeptidase-like regulatory domain-containing protein [Bacteroidota bacterium]